MLTAVPAHCESVRCESVLMRYFGHASWQIETPQTHTTILLDPWRNSIWSHWFDVNFPVLTDDILLSTHHHFDHSGLNQVHASQTLRGPGVLTGADYQINGVPGLHARSEQYGSENTVYIIRVGGVVICHWGDNGPNIPAEVMKLRGAIDVLIIPVDDSEHLLTTREVRVVRDQLRPRVLVPMHYYMTGLTSPCSSLRGIDKWIKGQSNVRRFATGEVDLSRNCPATSPSEDVWVFDKVDASVVAKSRLIHFPCLLQRELFQLAAAILFAATLIGWWYARHGSNLH